MERRTFLKGIAASLLADGAFSKQIESRGKYKWVQVAESGPFPIRDSATTFKYSERVWLSNGYQVGGVNVRDLWVSGDGVHWTLVSDSTPYQPYSPICDFGDAIYAVDGSVWKSDAGKPFVRIPATNVPRWLPEAKMLEFNNKLHIIDLDRVHHYDVAKSDFTSTPLPWPAREFGAAVVFNSRIYVMSGCRRGVRVPPEAGLYQDRTSVRDVWSSGNPEDPNSWICHTEKAPWAGRFWPAAAVHAGYLYLVGGYDNISSSPEVSYNFDDTWRTVDGENWELVNVESSFTGRHAPNIFSKGGSLMLIAGNTNRGTSVQKDIWKLVPA